MAWGEMTQEQIIAKLKEAGFDTAQINERLKTLDGVATKAEVTELSNSMKTIQDNLTSLQNSLKTANNNPDGNNGGDNNGGRRPTPDTNRSGVEPLNIDPLAFMENPQDATRKLVNEALAPVTIHTLGVAADMEYNLASQRLEHFKIFEDEIKQEWNKFPVQVKTKPRELIDNIYNMVIGRHIDDIKRDSLKKEGRFNIIQAGGTTTLPATLQGGGNNNQQATLTDQEKAVAAKMGMSEQEYADSKKGLRYV